jgi:hypothetical protein
LEGQPEMKNQLTKEKLFRNMVILNVGVFFVPLFMWLISGHLRESIISQIGLFGLPIIILLSSAKLSHKQFLLYWLLIVLTVHLTVFAGCVVVSLSTGYEVRLLVFLLQAIMMGIVTFIFWGLFAILFYV